MLWNNRNLKLGWDEVNQDYAMKITPVSSPPLTRPIALVGMMGAGKSTVGQALAERLGLPFTDVDIEIARAAGQKAADVIRTQGEPAFRRLERDTIAVLLRHREPFILALGGGAMMDTDTRALLRTRTLSIWLKADPATLLQRIGTPDDRPMLQSHDPEMRLKELLSLREPFYAEAHVTLESAGLSVEQTVTEILSRLA
jgi:shikimate kinase